VRIQGHWTAHGLGQQLGKVIHGWSPFDFKVGKQVTMRLGENHSQVVPVRLRPRLGQRPKIGLPGVVFLAQALELALDEERCTLAEFQAVLLVGHGHFLFCAFVLFATNSESSPP